MTIKDIQWMDRARCKDKPTRIFYPDVGESTAKAKGVCINCVVNKECLIFALTSPVEDDGVWGGFSAHERRAIRRKIRAKNAQKIHTL